MPFDAWRWAHLLQSSVAGIVVEIPNKEHKLLKLKRASPVVQSRHRILHGREKPKVIIFLNQCRSQICWHESWVLFNNIMSVKFTLLLSFYFLFPAPRKVNQRFLSPLVYGVSGFVCVYLFIVERNHDPLTRDHVIWVVRGVAWLILNPLPFALSYQVGDDSSLQTFDSLSWK